jgi:hypothetical protein
MRAWLTPTASGDPVVTRCLCIPPEFLPAFNGALQMLLEEFNWEEFGDQSPADCVATVQSIMDAYYSGECIMTAPAQQMAATLWGELNVVAGNTIRWVANSTQQLGGYWEQFTNAQNDIVEWNLQLDEGVYLLSILGVTQTKMGITTVYVDSVSQGTIDWYSAALTQNVLKTISVSVLVGGNHEIEFKAATKNSSATQYSQSTTWLQIHRTGDL